MALIRIIIVKELGTKEEFIELFELKWIGLKINKLKLLGVAFMHIVRLGGAFPIRTLDELEHDLGNLLGILSG
jgi:hypothetical protein